jgi:hypothetical protein
VDRVFGSDREQFEELEATYKEEYAQGEKMPLGVVSALEILRYEKIERWASSTWFWAEEPEYDRDVLRIADGSKDKVKQDALYVRIARDGSLIRTPQSVTVEGAEQEVKKANRCRWNAATPRCLRTSGQPWNG